MPGWGGDGSGRGVPGEGTASVHLGGKDAAADSWGHGGRWDQRPKDGLGTCILLRGLGFLWHEEGPWSHALITSGLLKPLGVARRALGGVGGSLLRRLTQHRSRGELKASASTGGGRMTQTGAAGQTGGGGEPLVTTRGSPGGGLAWDGNNELSAGWEVLSRSLPGDTATETSQSPLRSRSGV